MSVVPAIDARTHRCKVICQALGLQPAVGGQFVGQVTQVGKSLTVDRADNAVAYLLSLAYFGRVAEADEAVRIGQLVDSESPDEIDRALQTWPACREATGRNQFLPTDPDTTYVDVSHTLFLRRNSGIQRVVRKLAAALVESGHRHVFVRFDGRLRGYRPLTEAEQLRLLDWERFGALDRRTVDPDQKNWLKRRLKQFGRSRYGQPIRRFSRSLRERSRDLRRKLKRGLFGRREQPLCYFLWQGRLLLPEVIGAPGQLDFLPAVLSAAPLQSTMIVYDLLPITHPECFVSNTLSSFVQYLTLVRHVDQISCISDTVRQQLEPLLPAMPRTKPPACITAHLLAGDFQTQPATTAAPNRLWMKSAAVGCDDLQPRKPSAFSGVAQVGCCSPAYAGKGHGGLFPRTADGRPAEPVVLCVGTIEPRKNQTRILRAMVAAQEAGCRFRGVFAGNAGWLNGQFRDELKAARSRGIHVELHEGVTDNALAELYRTASLTVYCSLAEGFGLPVVESVMAGVPCLTSQLGSMEEIANQLGGCSLVNPHDTSEMAAAIGRLVEDRQELARLTAAAKQAQWWSWRDYCEQLMQFVAADRKPVAIPAEQRVAAAC